MAALRGDAARRNPETAGEATLVERIASSVCGAVVTSLIVTPLDVVKTRMQSGLLPPSGAAFECGYGARGVQLLGLDRRCMHGCYEGVISGSLHRVALTSRGAASHAQEAAAAASDAGRVSSSAAASSSARVVVGSAGEIRGTLDGIVKIARHEGLPRLYSGLQPTLIMAVPNTVLYFTCYDELKHRLHALSLALAGGSGKAQGDSPMWVHMLSGSIARTIAVVTVAPIEYVRTRVQAGITPAASPAPTSTSVSGAPVQAPPGRQPGSLWSTLAAACRGEGGVLTLYRGVVPTLLRDVPFSAMYFAGYEYLKLRLSAALRAHRARTAGEVEGGLIATFGPSFVAGLLSGGLAAVVTTPADVIKTQIQIQTLSSEQGLFGAPGRAAAAGGPSGGHAAASTSAAATAYQPCAQANVMTLRHAGGGSSSINMADNTIVHHTAECIERRALQQGQQHPTCMYPHRCRSQGLTTRASSHPTWAHAAAPSAPGPCGGGHAVSPSNMMETARMIVRTQGWMGLFTGVMPRVAKVAPACGIMISSYEVGKWFFSRRAPADS